MNAAAGPSSANPEGTVHVRAGIQQAKANEQGMKIVSFELVVIGLIVGFRMGSLGAGIITAVGGLILFMCLSNMGETARNVVSGIFGVAWAVAAWLLFSSASSSTQVAAAVIAGIVGIGGHLAAFQSMRDLQR
jgi:hypothetical protein